MWLAQDESTGREVALKIVARQGRATQRAEREAEAVSRLRHPGCARSLTLAEDDQHVYLVYEYIPGRTLREALRSRELTDAQVVEIAAQLLESLDHAHS
ncbi:MAG: protein kinase domain-containing protein, partial [Gaiellaceae bacterium]